MIEVKLYLYDAQEIALMAQFDAILAQKRGLTPPEAPVVSTTTVPNAPIGAPPTPGAVLMNDTTQAAMRAAEAGDVTHAENAADLIAKLDAPVEVDDVTVQRTITAYGQKHGVPATIARMQEFFGVSKASLVPAERRAEFVGVFAV